jgi:predicted Zn-dependent protease
VPLPPLPLEAIADRAARLVARSPADLTSVCWVETVRSSAKAGERGRRRDARRAVTLRVRVGGRSGTARADAGEVGELEIALRGALADARLAPPSPDWPIAAAAVEHLAAGSADPEVVALATGAESTGGAPARLGDAGCLRWLEARVAVASSFQPPRAHRFTSATLEIASDDGPGAGFAARTAISLAALDAEALRERARALAAAAASSPSGAADGRPLVLGGEAAIALLDALARHALSGRERLARGGLWPYPFAAGLTVDDEPDGSSAPALPFDLDGCARARRRFVDGGRAVAAALDLELAARAGEPTTSHGLAADDAWPEHLAIAPGSRAERDLLASCAGGVRVGRIRRIRVEPEGAYRFRAVAAGLREIGATGELGASLPPATWSGSLAELFGAVREAAGEPAIWSPDASSFGAHRAPALLLAPVGRFEPDR